MPLISGRDISNDRNSGPLEPEAIALMAEVLNRHPCIDLNLAAAGRAHRQVIDKAADFVAHFGRKPGTHYVERYVRSHVHVTAVIDKAPARAVVHDAPDNRRRIAVIRQTIAM